MSRMGTLAIALLLVLAAGCSSVQSLPNPLASFGGAAIIHVDAPVASTAAPLLRGGQSLALVVTDLADARPGSPGRKVGDIRATVLDIHASEFALDQDVSAVLSGAVRAQLGADGFRLASSGDADFRLTGVIRKFSLDIAGRDELAIAVETTLRDARTGQVVWAGVIEEKSDRYAGVNGNSRASIAEYLGVGVAAFAARLGAAVRANLHKAYPQAMASGQREAAAIPGVTTTQFAPPREAPAVAPPPQAPPVQPAPLPRAASPTGGLGHVQISSIPARVKVYVDDVYYGVTPIKIELPVGVGQLGFKLDGYKPASEKVAVRRGEVTELEVKLAK
ncbi:MAG: PEGA domain-containing protein [Sulfurisoma sp.]|nr:PEGA domain-containing protein [Sulfurisoma sp.]